MSFDLEKALHTWKRSLFKSESMEDGYAEELESHLREEIRRLQDMGMGDEEAFRKASRDLGPAREIGREYAKARTRDIDGRFLLARAYYKLGKLEETIELYGEIESLSDVREKRQEASERRSQIEEELYGAQ